MTIAAALPLLMKIQRRAQSIAPVLGCRGAPHEVPASAREIDDLDWSVCPLCLLGHPLLAALRQFDHLLAASPVAGWPDRFAPWAVAGVLYLRQSEAR